MNISGPLYRRSPKRFSGRNKPGDWTLVWCELQESGDLYIFQDVPTAADTPATRKLVSLPIVECDIAHVRSDGRESIEITYRKQARKETLSSHESSYDIDWWMNSLLSVKRDLERGVRPRLSIVCPPSSDAPTRQKSIRRQPSSSGMQRPSFCRRQPTLEATITRFERYTIYETTKMFYIVCSDRHYTRFRLLSLDRTIERPTSLGQVLSEDLQVYTWEGIEAKLQQLAEITQQDTTSNPSSVSKLVRAFTAVAIVGCLRFLRGYYFIFVTQRRKIGCIGGNFIYSIAATQQLNISLSQEGGSAWGWFHRWFNPSPEEEAEARYLGLFHFIDLTKDFYFSYSYDVTHTLQYNMTRQDSISDERFTWNEYLTREFGQVLTSEAQLDLMIPIVLGCYEQRKCSVFGRLISIILLARRSRHFAGTRYLKRGVADTGKTANDVETEQIIEDENMGTGRFSSFVQHRGSIPVFWSQETSATLPKPPIVLNRVDPTYSACRKHFSDLFSRYGSPIIALNLIKQSEKKEREVIVGNEFMNAVEYLNSFIPPCHRIRYIALDYSRLSKQKGLNVLHSLDKVAVWTLTQTGFFCSAPKRQIGRNDGKQSIHTSYESLATNIDKLKPLPSPTIPRKSGDWLEQKGILRTNCIDCLDRTNVCQFSVGMRALGQQLYAMGIRNTPLLESRSHLVRVLMGLYSLLGDAISMQYGGSEAHKNVKTSAGRESVKHREFLTSIRRYYSNSFTDMAKQDAINIFLGHFIPKEGEPPLWELDSDYYLHNFEVRHGTEACEQVRHTLEMQAESKRTALCSIPSTPSLFTPLLNDDPTDCQGPMHVSTIKDKRRREAYVRECKRLLEDWWKQPLETFEQPALVVQNSSTRSLLDQENIMSMNIPTKPWKKVSDTFLQMYHPEELTSFDKTLGYKFMSPMDLSRELNEEKPPRNRVTRSSFIETSTSVGGSFTMAAIGAMTAPLSMNASRSTSVDEIDVNNMLLASKRAPAVASARAYRSMSAPDIELEASLSVARNEFSARQLRYDESDPLNVDVPALSMSHASYDSGNDKSTVSNTVASGALDAGSVLCKGAIKRKEEQISIEEYLQSRSHKKFVGDCTPVPPDNVYERYVQSYGSISLWEVENESVKMYFEAYLRNNHVDVDDARGVREAQVRGGATFKVQTGPYAGLDQSIKARMLVAKKVKVEPESRKVYEDSMDYKRLMSTSSTSLSPESIEIYKSFFDDELPEVQIYPSRLEASMDTNDPSDALCETKKEEPVTAFERQLSEDVRKMTTRCRRGRFDLISVGPMFKLDGGKDQDFILFNEAAAENEFAEVIKNETELSFYVKK